MSICTPPLHVLIKYAVNATHVLAQLASCLINAQPLSAHFPAAAQGHDLTDDWSLPNAHFVDS